MTDSQKELIQLWHDADEDGKAMIFDLLIVAVAVGEPFYTEMKTYLENKDTDSMRACVARYKAACSIQSLQIEQDLRLNKGFCKAAKELEAETE